MRPPRTDEARAPSHRRECGDGRDRAPRRRPPHRGSAAPVTRELPAGREAIGVHDQHRPPLPWIGELLDPPRLDPGGAVVRDHRARPVGDASDAAMLPTPTKRTVRSGPAHLGDGDGRAPRRAQPGVQRVTIGIGIETLRVLLEQPHRRRDRPRRRPSHDRDRRRRARRAIALDLDRPRIAADCLRRFRRDRQHPRRSHRAPPARSACSTPAPSPPSRSGARIDVELGRLALDGAEPGPGRPRGRVAVAPRLGQVERSPGRGRCRTSRHRRRPYATSARNTISPSPPA